MTSVIMVKDSRHSSRRVSIRGLGGQGNPGKYHRRSGFWGVTRSLPQRRQWHTTPVLLPGKYHRWRSLVSCSPWGLEESDMTERLHFHFSLLRIGEGNGNPLQCSCLENPRDGVTQSRTWLKWFSSSSRDLFKKIGAIKRMFHAKMRAEQWLLMPENSASVKDTVKAQ